MPEPADVNSPKTEQPTAAGCLLALFCILLACGVTTAGGVLYVRENIHWPAVPRKWPIFLVLGSYGLCVGTFYLGSSLLNAIGIRTWERRPNREIDEP